MKYQYKGPRYITRGIVSKIDFCIINEIWKVLDRFVSSKKMEQDYLQIFNLNTKKEGGLYTLVIQHEQEIPEYINKEALIVKINQPINDKVYIISDYDEEGNEYSTMLLASEY